MKQQKGFTLIEVLVVISIIGLLSSVVFSKLADARSRAYIAGGLSFGSTLDHQFSHEISGIWGFDELSGSMASDSSGENMNASVTGTYTWVKGIVGNAIYLDTNAGIDIGMNQVYASSDFTISFWLKPDGFLGGDGRWSNVIIDAGSYGVDGFRFGMNNDGSLTLWSTENAGTLHMTSSIPISKSRFNHIVITYSNNKAEMYFDGRKVAAGNGLCLPVSELNFNRNVGFGHGNKMTYDNIRFYNSSLLAK